MNPIDKTGEFKAGEASATNLSAMGVALVRVGNSSELRLEEEPGVPERECEREEEREARGGASSRRWEGKTGPTCEGERDEDRLRRRVETERESGGGTRGERERLGGVGKVE